ncbi:TPA: hypothetical protein ACFNMF_000748 [Neisseria lactamica]
MTGTQKPDSRSFVIPAPSSFPRKWESRNEKQQEFIGNNRNRTDWIPACAGMTAHKFPRGQIRISVCEGMTGFQDAVLGVPLVLE